MNTSRLIKILAILVVAALATGCKLEIVSVQGGDIGWSGGSCSEGSNCIIEITDPTFSDTFTVTPKPGYEFVKWQKAPGFLCGDSTAPCAVTMPADANLAAAVVGTFTRSYIMPVYKDVGINTDGDSILRDELDEDDDNDGLNDDLDTCPLEGPNLDGFGCPSFPITDTITADGKVWAQVDLFENLTWNQINAVCPEGVCVNGGVLNGYDMTGWTWADVGQVANLFVFYGAPYQYVGSQPSGGINTSWAPAIFAAGWRPTFTQHIGVGTFDENTVLYLSGWASTTNREYGDSAYCPRIIQDIIVSGNQRFGDQVYMESIPKTALCLLGPSLGGSWFYRSL